MNGGHDPNAKPVDVTQLERIDEICDRFEAEWKAGNRPQIEDYLSSVPEDHRGELLRCLLEQELEYREKQGEAVTAGGEEAPLPEDLGTGPGAVPSPR
ncbi:MAG: hypothetical protein H8E44_40985, partial [Planctomycetes bacterium]|nr:hypothetical protein [Planctomycetota bacterium]